MGCLEQKEIDRFMNLIDLMRSQRSRSSSLLESNKGQKKELVLRFIQGPLKKEIQLNPDDMPIVFGKTEG